MAYLHFAMGLSLMTLIDSESLRGLSIGIAKAEVQPYNDTRGMIVGGRITRVSLIDHDFWTL